MAAAYADFEFHLEARSPIAADSPFDSDTLWGRILCALAHGSEPGQRLVRGWLDELAAQDGKALAGWRPPLLVSEGFQYDEAGEPWLPVPLAMKLKLEQTAGRDPKGDRKRVKKLETIPSSKFFDVCRSGMASLDELTARQEERPCVEPAIQPHLATNRASSTGLDGLLYATGLHLYRPHSRPLAPADSASSTSGGQRGSAQAVFFLRLRDADEHQLVGNALRQICDEGWGNSKSRGLGQIRFKRFDPWSFPDFDGIPEGFVSLSNFCPARSDPVDGLWKLQPKHPVPPQFVNGRRVVLGEESGKWRVKSFLRLRAGSCFRLASDRNLRDYYGRMLTGLLEPSEDGDGQPLPPLFHYALAFPVPIKWPEE